MPSRSNSHHNMPCNHQSSSARSMILMRRGATPTTTCPATTCYRLLFPEKQVAEQLPPQHALQPLITARAGSDLEVSRSNSPHNMPCNLIAILGMAAHQAAHASCGGVRVHSRRTPLEGNADCGDQHDPCAHQGAAGQPGDGRVADRERAPGEPETSRTGEGGIGGFQGIKFKDTRYPYQQ